MVFTIFNTSEDKPEPGGLKYATRNPTARVLRGDPVITQAVIDATPAYVRHRFTAGVVSEATKLDAAQENVIADNVEYHLRGARPEEAVSSCLIAHSDKGKSEIHFITPRIDLLCNKIVDPYVDRIDRHRFRAVTEFINLKFGFDNPLDNRRIEPPWEHLRIANDAKEFLFRVWQEVHAAVEKGTVCNRRELAAFLLSSGYQVRCQKHDGGDLAQPVIQSPGGKQLRLKGSIYYTPEFGIKPMKVIDKSNPDAVAVRLKELEEEIRMTMDFRAHWTIGRLFGRYAQQGIDKGCASRVLNTLLKSRMADLHRTEPAIRLFSPGSMRDLKFAIENGLDFHSVAPLKAKTKPTETTLRAPAEADHDEPGPQPSHPLTTNAGTSTKTPKAKVEETPAPKPAQTHNPRSEEVPMKAQPKAKKKPARKPPGDLEMPL
jgi:hypothetical protein